MLHHLPTLLLPKVDNAPSLPYQKEQEDQEAQEFNKPIAEDMYENIKKVGLPTWSEDDQTLARALQRELKVPVRGLAAKIQDLRVPRQAAESDGGEGGVGPTGGGSDDIGDVSGPSQPSRCRIRQTFREGRVTTGQTVSRWRRLSRIRVSWQVPRFRR